jgi:hypothetical protein
MLSPVSVEKVTAPTSRVMQKKSRRAALCRLRFVLRGPREAVSHTARVIVVSRDCPRRVDGYGDLKLLAKGLMKADPGGSNVVMVPNASPATNRP